MKKLEGRSALVTGAGRRIGRAIALALAAEGANVAITFRGFPEQASQTVADIEALGVRSLAVQTELCEPESIRSAVRRAVDEFGSLDVLVNNAGRYETAALDTMTIEQWDTMFAVNTRAPFLMAQAALPHLRVAQGRIINVGSLGGTHPWATHAHYSSSKAALHMLTRTMSRAFAPEVNVNCVAPGMIAQGTGSPDYEYFARKTPMRRNGTPEEVADAVVFFASGPHFITGQILGVDGGLGL